MVTLDSMGTATGWLVKPGWPVWVAVRSTGVGTVCEKCSHCITQAVARLSAAGAVVVRVHGAARMDVDRDLPRVHNLQQVAWSACTSLVNTCQTAETCTQYPQSRVSLVRTCVPCPQGIGRPQPATRHRHDAAVCSVGWFFAAVDRLSQRSNYCDGSSSFGTINMFVRLGLTFRRMPAAIGAPSSAVVPCAALSRLC